VLISAPVLRKIIRRYLNEGRLEDIQKKYPHEDINFLAQNDPSGSKLKYLAWMARELSVGNTQRDVFPTIEYFHRNLSKFPSKDINSYKSLYELESAAKSISEKKSSKEKRQEIKSGSDAIFEDNEVALIYVGTKESCRLYGKGTKWCITMRDANYFEQYTGANVVFYFLLRKLPIGDPFDKVAFAVKRNKQNIVIPKDVEFYDAEDRPHYNFHELSNEFINFNSYVNLAFNDAKSRPKALLTKIMDDEATPEELHKALILYKDDKRTIQTIAPKLKDPSDLLLLSKYKDVTVRCFVASSENTPKEALLTLSQDGDAYVRIYVSENSNTPEEALEKLAGDVSASVARSVSMNKNATAKALDKLARHADQSTRINVVMHPNTSQKTIDYLSTHERNASVINALFKFQKNQIQ